MTDARALLEAAILSPDERGWSTRPHPSVVEDVLTGLLGPTKGVLPEPRDSRIDWWQMKGRVGLNGPPWLAFAKAVLVLHRFDLRGQMIQRHEP